MKRYFLLLLLVHAMAICTEETPDPPVGFPVDISTHPLTSIVIDRVWFRLFDDTRAGNRSVSSRQLSCREKVGCAAGVPALCLLYFGYWYLHFSHELQRPGIE